jgi:hypothetical protein
VIFTSAGTTWEFNPGLNQWTDRTPATSPVARWVHGMVFDSGRNRTLLFGGRNLDGSGADYNDTWEWDGSAGTWTARTPSVLPPMTESPGMVYDPVHARTIMVAANDSNTWEWDGSNWTSLAVASPQPGPAFNMVWDSFRNTVVLFKPTTDGGSGPGIWEWQIGQSAWTQVAVGCTTYTDRANTAVAYVPGRKQVVFFGGEHLGTDYHILNDLWGWSPGSPSWQQFTESSTLPPGQYSSDLVYDDGRARLLLLTGGTVSGYTADLWQLTF